MPTKTYMIRVGAPDPDRKTSPIIDRSGDDFESPDFAAESGYCYFNGTPYAIGQYIRSGDEVLQCAERGIWVHEETDQ